MDIDPSTLSENEISRALLQFHLRRATSHLTTGMFVQADLQRPDTVRTWGAALGGKILATPEYFTSGGRYGCCVKFDSPLGTRRQIWITAKFMSLHKPLADVLLQFMASAGAKWELPVVSLTDVRDLECALHCRCMRFECD